MSTTYVITILESQHSTFIPEEAKKVTTLGTTFASTNNKLKQSGNHGKARVPGGVGWGVTVLWGIKIC